MSEIVNLIQNKIYNTKNSARKQRRVLSGQEREDIEDLENCIEYFKGKGPDGPLSGEEVEFIQDLYADVYGKKINLRKNIDSRPKGQTVANLSAGRSKQPAVNSNAGMNKFEEVLKALKNKLGCQDSSRFKNLGEMLLAVRTASEPNSKIDPRFYNAASGANETIPSEGGFLVPREWARDILQDAFNEGQLMRRCRRQPIGKDFREAPINKLPVITWIASVYSRTG